MGDAPPPYNPYNEVTKVVDSEQPAPQVVYQPAPQAVYQPAQPNPVIIQQQQPPIIIHQQQPQVVTVTRPNVVVVGGVKEAADYEPYQEFCPYCNEHVRTNVRYEWGTCTWIYCIIAVFVCCWPLIFAICCNCSKDAYHYCPCCQKLLATKKR